MQSENTCSDQSTQPDTVLVFLNICQIVPHQLYEQQHCYSSLQGILILSNFPFLMHHHSCHIIICCFILFNICLPELFTVSPISTIVLCLYSTLTHLPCSKWAVTWVWFAIAKPLWIVWRDTEVSNQSKHVTLQLLCSLSNAMIVLEIHPTSTFTEFKRTLLYEKSVWSFKGTSHWN